MESKILPLPWCIRMGDQIFDCSAFISSGERCDFADTDERGDCHPSMPWLLLGNADDSHNPKFCVTHYFQGMGDGTQFDDCYLAPLEEKAEPPADTSETVTLTLKRTDAGQIVDGLRSRQESWQNTASYLRDGYCPDDDFVAEDCHKPEEAQSIANHYAEIIAAIEAQL